MISPEPLPGFRSKFDVVSCYLEHDGKFAVLHRHAHKSQGGKWGVAAGKVEKGESFSAAMKREIEEETGIKIAEEELRYFTKLYVRHGDYDFVYHMFHAKLSFQPTITIREEEHSDSGWVSPREALSLNLVDDLDYCIKLFYNLP